MLTIEQGLDVAKSLGLPIYDHSFGNGSERNLEGVLPSIVKVARLAIKLCEYDGTVIPNGGLRTQAAADQNNSNGTGISNSRHLKKSDGWGHAIDCIALTPGSGIDWTNMKAFRAMADAIKLAAAILSVPIRMGCDWNMNGTFAEGREWDWSHFEDPKEIYKPAAIAEMHRYRRVLGLDDKPVIPALTPATGCKCPHCNTALRLVLA